MKFIITLVFGIFFQLQSNASSSEEVSFDKNFSFGSLSISSLANGRSDVLGDLGTCLVKEEPLFYDCEIQGNDGLMVNVCRKAHCLLDGCFQLNIPRHQII